MTETKILTNVEKELEEQGFSVVPSFIEKKICDKLNSIISKQKNILPQKYDKNMVYNVHKTIPEFLAIQSYPPIVQIIEKILKGPILGLQSQYFFGDTPSAGFAPHQDGYYHQAGKENLMSVWIALDNIGPENGGLIFWANSHHEGLLPVQPVEQNPFKRVIVPKKYSKVDLRVKKGDTVFIHPDVIHGSYDNPNPKENLRRAMLMLYIREGVPYRAGKRAKRKTFPLEYREELL